MDIGSGNLRDCFVIYENWWLGPFPHDSVAPFAEQIGVGKLTYPTNPADTLLFLYYTAVLFVQQSFKASKRVLKYHRPIFAVVC
jgi:hypothetical protein